MPKSKFSLKDEKKLQNQIMFIKMFKSNYTLWLPIICLQERTEN